MGDTPLTKIKRGKLVFYISDNKIYFKTNPQNPLISQTFIIYNTKAVNHTKHRALVAYIQRGSIRNLQDLATYCDRDMSWVNTGIIL